MGIITSQEQMVRHLPNTLKAVEGEKSLYEKVEAYLDSAERWLTQNICEASWISSEHGTQLLGEAVIVNHALFHAVPALDLVLTPNGFGIVNNQNVVPASKERVENLRMSLRDARDATLTLLIHALADIDALASWRDTPQGKWFCSTMFPYIESVDEYSDEEIESSGSKWEKYVKLRTKISFAEELLQTKYFGSDLMDVLRERSQTGLLNANPKVLFVLRHAKMAVRTLVKKEKGCLEKAHRICCTAIETIRMDDTVFAVWHNSNMPAIWNPTLFENKKENGGYFF